MKLQKETAEEIHRRGLTAITELSKALQAAAGRCSEEEYAGIKKAIGMTIGRIQTDILDPLNTLFPELDDLA